jgi:hypothetical protein
VAQALGKTIAAAKRLTEIKKKRVAAATVAQRSFEV